MADAELAWLRARFLLWVFRRDRDVIVGWRVGTTQATLKELTAEAMAAAVDQAESAKPWLR